ncbi:MAG: alpha/beta hydrolase [Bacteroidales bacterium]|jgi:acetyl esterase/lipase|nr:alpha/beta hydrolase [Bacteroidales bacterium]
MKRGLLFFWFLSIVGTLFAYEKISLWKDVDSMKREKTNLYVFKPADSLHKNVAVVICPGGSYAHLYGIKWEGFEVAQWLNENGITAFVLQYRVGKHKYRHPAMLEDIQRSIQWVREHADHYQINSEKVGVMGFSAGGHLSLMSGIFCNENYLEEIGVKSDVPLKPAFIVPVYPVVSMQDDIAHVRSRKNLLGKKINQEEKDKFSMELQVSKELPPVFLVTAKDDPVVDYRNSLVLKQSLDENGIFNKFLLYEKGGHGFGIDEKRGGEAAQWRQSFTEWLYEIGILE